MNCAIGLLCENCGNKTPESGFQYKCASCGGVLGVEYDLDKMKKRLSSRVPGVRSGSILKQWMEVLPINNPELIDRVYLGEDETPIIR